ncbi:MAG: PucR family transcriptional regulator [Pseudonocardia sp.]|nr:PucR family transcriptional regulator [Pseudonocardia sp.]
MYPTLAEVLDLPVLKAAAPRVRAGSAGLDARIRWVHVSEQRNPAGTLSGGELVLSIGVAVADPTTDAAAYVAALRDAGAVGLVVELGQHVRSLPSTLVQAARAAEFPLVELARAVRFVEVTEIVHAQIVNSQYARMQFIQRVHDTFRTLAVESGEVNRVLVEAATLIGLPVVLEDLRHRALSFAGDFAAARLLKDWTARSHQVPVAPRPSDIGPEGWMTMPVGPRSRRWGRLVVPQRVVDDAVAENVAMVLEHAADALTIGRLLGDDSLGLELEAQGELLKDLLRGTTLDEPALRARARALGLPTGSALTVVVVGASAADPHDRELLEAAVAATRTLRTTAIVGRLAPGRVGIVAARRSGKGEAGFPERVVELLPSGSVSVAAAAGPVTAFAELASALAEAAFVVDVQAATAPSVPVRIWRSSDLGVRGLLWQLRADPRLLAYVDAQLGALLRLDDRVRGQMLDTLSAYLEAGGVMTAFAVMINLSRPAAYARLARLRQVLGCDLDEPRTRLSLHVAMLALQQDRDLAAPAAR